MASHDLSFTVNNGAQPHDGTTMSMSQLPNNNMMNPNPNTSMGSTTTTTTATTSKPGTLEFVQEQLKQSSHPFVIIFHVLFKFVALFFYIFGGWFVGSSSEKGARFISLTVICILLLAADFWVVKNVTGRLLVGLRWWNKVEDEGTKWIFESAEGKRPVNSFDRNVFWSVLYGTPLVWGILFILGMISFKLNWLLIVVMALTLSGANVYGYYKCSTEQKTSTQQMMQQYAQQGAIAVMRSNMLSVLTGAATGALGSPTNNNNNNNTPNRGNFV